MSDPQAILLTGRRGTPTRVPYLPDLTLWYKWRQAHGGLPKAWQGYSLPQVAHALGVSAWIVERPWHAEHPGLAVETAQTENERSIRYETAAGTLTARWSLGPDGDWWQTEYPVKAFEDLPAAHAIIAARQYILDAPPALGANSAPPTVEGAFPPLQPASITAIELPMRPYSDLIHTLLGWGEGLMLLKGEGRPIILEMLALLEDKLAALTGEVAALPGDILLAPDNLDGQYISPRVFREQMAESYRRTAQSAHSQARRLVVHAGGPVRRLLPLLAETGVDVVEGIAPAPQGDASLAEARTAAGPSLILWGGIPQDYLLATRDPGEFEAAVREAARQAAEDDLAILGVADRVPVEADLTRLQVIPQLLSDFMAS